jgi:glycosyltransferase involved in cell wall biosynthesis
VKVAIVHDWLVGGGAERVVEQLHVMFPEAPIYTSYATNEWRQRLDNKVKTGWLQHLGFLRKYIPFLRILWFTHLKFNDYDLVITSSGNGEAKGVITGPGTIHINYCHAPTHFYWRHYDQYLKQPGFGILNPLAKLGLKLFAKSLKKWDYQAAQRADYIIANSSHTRDEIKTFYDRESTVLHPPVNVERFHIAHIPSRSGFVTAGRQVPYKKTELIIEACNQLKLPLLVIGKGPEHQKLVHIAGETVQFRDDVSDKEMPKLLAESKAFLFAAYEDFGVTPVEAMAAGTPVLAYKAGGALDYVVPGRTGEFFEEQTVESLVGALRNFRAESYEHAAISALAQDFSDVKFRYTLKTLIDNIHNKNYNN